jgi:hypothetical protein
MGGDSGGAWVGWTGRWNLIAVESGERNGGPGGVQNVAYGASLDNISIYPFLTQNAY